MVKESEQTTRTCPACALKNAKKVGNKSGFEILVCRSCKTIYTSRVPEQNEAENYDEYYTAANLSAPEFIRYRLEEIVGSFAPYRKSNRLLDVGFGSGTILQTARDLCWEISGQEVSKPAIEQARGLGFDVFHGELEDAKFPDGHFDVVTASEVIEHLPEPQKTLHEIARILRPGGLLWATTPSARSLSFRLMKEKWTVLSPPDHTQLYSKKGVQIMLAKVGFHDLNIQTLGMNPSELINHYRDGRNKEEQFDRVTAGYELNKKMTGSRSGKLIKSMVNILLDSLQLGDSLKIYAQKADV